MLLAIDVGNTNTVLGLFEGDELRRLWRTKTDARSTGDEIMLTIRGLLEGSPDVSGIALCSTVPSVLREMREMFARYYRDVPTVIVEPGTKTGVPVLTDNPKEVGADRIANTLAAHHLFGGPCIVVDFGTTTNFDVVSADGDFLGGAFAPGLEVSAQSLFSRASRLFAVSFTAPKDAIGKNTADCLRSGIIFGYVGLVEGLLGRILAEIPGGTAKVIATGGLAPTIVPLTTRIERVDDDLTLEGLRLLWELNAA